RATELTERLDRSHAGVAAEQDDISAPRREKSDGYDTDDRADLRFRFNGIQDRESVHVEDHVAVVGAESHPQRGLAAEQHELPRHVASRHRYHFDGQGKLAEDADELRLVGDADELSRDSRHDLFARQRAAATLDHGAPLGHFVGAVHVDGNVVHTVEILDVDAVPMQPLGRLDRARHGTLDPMLDLRELVDEEVGGRPGADAHHRIVGDVPERLAGDRLLLYVLRHLDPRRFVNSWSAARWPCRLPPGGASWRMPVGKPDNR